MRRFRLLLLTLALATAATGQDYNALFNEAKGQYRNKEYSKSVETFKAAFKIKQTSGGALYDAGCSAALAGDSALAFEWLRAAMDRGWLNLRHLKSDSDLNSLHDTAEWKKLTDEMQAKLDAKEAAYDKPLQAQLLAILDEDQKYRLQIDAVEKKSGRNSKEMRDLWAVIEKKDHENLAKVTAILDQQGWVGPDKIGNEANGALFLVIQHSDLKTQEKYLPMMRAAVEEKKASGSSLALLEDRVALGEGRRQIYGSQIGRDNKSGEYYLSPLDDPDHVDQRRASVGLPPLAEYVKHWNMTWDVAAYKKQLPALDKKEHQ